MANIFPTLNCPHAPVQKALVRELRGRLQSCLFARLEEYIVGFLFLFLFFFFFSLAVFGLRAQVLITFGTARTRPLLAEEQRTAARRPSALQSLPTSDLVAVCRGYIRAGARS